MWTRDINGVESLEQGSLCFRWESGNLEFLKNGTEAPAFRRSFSTTTKPLWNHTSVGGCGYEVPK